MSRLEEHINAKPELSIADSANAAPAKTSRIARRDFLKTTATIGGGLWISAYVPELAGKIPTCENIARVIWNLLEPKIAQGRLHRVRLVTKGGYNWTDQYSWIVEAALQSSSEAPH